MTTINYTGNKPTKAHEWDAGYDLVAELKGSMLIHPGQSRPVPLGTSIALKPGLAGFIQPRSGLAAKKQVTILNSPGLIDPGYTGELQALVINHGKVPFTVNDGDRIAQLVIVPTVDVEFVEVEQLDETERGDGGFGSTGV